MIAFNDTFLFWVEIKTQGWRKLNKICIIIYLLLQITVTKSYKLNTTIIYTKMTNNDDIKHFLRKFHNYDMKKGFLMMILKNFKKVP